MTIFGSIDEALFGEGKTSNSVKSPSKTVTDPDALTVTTSFLNPKTKEPIMKDGKPRQVVMSLVDELVAYLNRETSRDPHNPKGADKVSKVNIILENAASYQAVKADGNWKGGPL